MSSSVSGGSSGNGRHRASRQHRGGGGGGGAQGRRQPPAALTPKQLLQEYTLPIAAHLLTPIQPSGVSLKRPLMLYENYTSTTVRAVSLCQGVDGSSQPLGPAILIPDTYAGWFSLVSPEGQTAPYFDSIQEVAESQTAFFLTRYDVPGYIRTDEDNGSASYNKTVVESGNVLKLMGVFEDFNSKKSSDQNKSDVANKYAQCLNYKNEVVFIPFISSGRFYSTASRTSINPDHVYLLAHILKTHKLPVVVKLVCGYIPNVPCSFTGLLKLERTEKEDTILACTMNYEAHATMFEIDVSANAVLAPVADPSLPKLPIFLKTLSYCQDEADAWRRHVKIKNYVAEKSPRSLSRSMSEKIRESTSSKSRNLSVFSNPITPRSRDKSKDRKSASLDKGRRLLRDRSVENKAHVDVTNETFSYKSYINKDKTEDKGLEIEKPRLTKQNTYVPDSKKSKDKVKDKKVPSERPKYERNSSNNSIDYSRVVDSLSVGQESHEGESGGESLYAEISQFALQNQQKNIIGGSLISLQNTPKNISDKINNKSNTYITYESSRSVIQDMNVSNSKIESDYSSKKNSAIYISKDEGLRKTSVVPIVNDTNPEWNCDNEWPSDDEDTSNFVEILGKKILINKSTNNSMSLVEPQKIYIPATDYDTQEMLNGDVSRVDQFYNEESYIPIDNPVKCVLKVENEKNELDQIEKNIKDISISPLSYINKANRDLYVVRIEI
ncbi:unnamed protein product [Meganyctiphanes norvegica]|uniref:CABIT domain-containing protein n=1 Tax=Meganyctiphanes norvegica TaxID=48144 RepID=A0AAV2RAL1_MEGNR